MLLAVSSVPAAQVVRHAPEHPLPNLFMSSGARSGWMKKKQAALEILSPVGNTPVPSPSFPDKNKDPPAKPGFDLGNPFGDNVADSSRQCLNKREKKKSLERLSTKL